VDENTRAQIIGIHARRLQQLHANDGFWNWVQGQQEFWTCLLARRKEVQSDAKRYSRNPIRFCEKYFPGAMQLPGRITKRQAQELLTMPDFWQYLTSANDIARVDGKQYLKKLQILAQNPSGRKRAPIYERALELSKAGKDLSTICDKLVPNYRGMPTYEQEAARRRMRSALARLEKEPPTA